MLGRLWGRSVGRENGLSARHYPASNTAAVVTLAAQGGRRYIVTKVSWSYDADPTGGGITITDGGSTIRKFAITKGGPGAQSYGTASAGIGAAVVVTLAAGGSGITGTLDVEYITEAE